MKRIQDSTKMQGGRLPAVIGSKLDGEICVEILTGIRESGREGKGLPTLMCYKVFLICHFVLNVSLASIIAADSSPPTILFPPQSQKVILWQPAAFGVIADGTTPLSFQWRKDGVSILGETNDQLLLRHAAFEDAGSYSVVVSNLLGAEVSNGVMLEVAPPRAGDVDFSLETSSFINAAVTALASQADGRLIIGGSFTTVSGALRGGVARLNLDGTVDHTFMNGLSGADRAVASVAIQDDGKILIGGMFGAVNGVVRPNLARLHRDGSLDTSLVYTATFTNGSISLISLQPDGKILIGGLHTERVMYCPTRDECPQPIGYPCCFEIDEQRPLLSRLNKDGSLDDSFRALIQDEAAVINALVLQDDGKVLIGASNPFRDDLSRVGNVTRLNSDGSFDHGFDCRLVATGVKCIALQSNGKIVVGGWFTNVGGISRNGIARFNSDGSLDGSFQHQLKGVDRQVTSVAVQDDGLVIIGGEFSNVNGITRRGLARLNESGDVDKSFEVTEASIPISVLALVLHGDRVVVGGQPAYKATRGCVKLMGNGSVDVDFNNWKPGINGSVQSLALQPDGRILVGASFEVFTGQNGEMLRLNRDGTYDPSFVRSDYVKGKAQTITPLANGNVLVGGFVGLYRLSDDGTLNRVLLERGPVYGVALQSDGGLVVGGGFGYRFPEDFCFGNDVQRINASGQWDRNYVFPRCALEGQVTAMVGQRDDRVVVAGQFGSISQAPSALFRLNLDGTVDSSFQPLISFVLWEGERGQISALGLQDDGKLLIGGRFYAHAAGGGGALNFARLMPDGSVDPTLPKDLAVDGWVRAIATSVDGAIVVGGAFSMVNGEARSGIARLNPDGLLDPSFSVRLRPRDYDGVTCVQIQEDGNILMGGGFHLVNGVAVSYLARLWGHDFVRPRIRNLALDERLVSLDWDAMPRTRYRVQYAPSLPAESWNDLGEEIVATGNRAAFIGSQAKSAVQTFYRVILIP